MKRWTAFAIALAAPAFAAEPTRPPDLEPAVNTSPAVVPATVPAVAPAPQTRKPAIPVASATAVAKPASTGRALDRLELDATQITGNRELPRVLYVVPWKRSDLGDLTGRPANSLLDEVLAPVDRDVFRRQNRYYDALKPDTGAGGAGKGAEVEK
jgi:hypothetical protein